MGDKQIRVGQLIQPFGPGSIYTDRRGIPHIVCGLDHWFRRWDQSLGYVACDNKAEFEKAEPRLSVLLHVDRFFTPPDFRFVRPGGTAPPNALLMVPAQRFPRWYRHTKTGEMRRFNLDTIRLENPMGGGRWQPVRFISVCAGGHLCEFPWKEWIGCSCSGQGNLHLTDRGGSELSSIRVECKSCAAGSSGRKGRNLAGTTQRPDEGEQSAFQQAGIICPGDRPWLGEGAGEGNCRQQLVGALINQTNLYFPKTISAIALPDLEPQDDSVTQLRNLISEDPSLVGLARTIWNMKDRPGTVAFVKSRLDGRSIPYDSTRIEEALEVLFDPSSATLPSSAAAPQYPESPHLTFRRAEFNIIRQEVNDADRVPNLRVVPVQVPNSLSGWFNKVNLVERLRVTRVFFGFDRLQQSGNPLTGMPESAMNQLFRDPPSNRQDRWLPAVEVFGEGIYLELTEERIRTWQSENVDWLTRRLDVGFVSRLRGIFETLPPETAVNHEWASRYLLVHTLAHVLITQLIFECGYSTASLRERLYVSADPAASMAGILIYTAAGDAEGTLGGLVRLGRPERLAAVMQRAISRASWCSADPICSEHLGGQGSRLVNLAGCHACVLLPETSCETINHGLDRGMLVGEPDARGHGFFSEILKEVYAL